MLEPEKRDRINNIADKLNILNKLKWPCFLILIVSEPLNWPGFIASIACWLFLLGCISAVAWHFLNGARCPYCQQPFGLRYEGTREVGSEAISVKKNIAVKNRNGEQIATSEQYVPGTRRHYTKVYVCKYCSGVKEVKARSKAQANF